MYDDAREREHRFWAIERAEFRNANQMFGAEGIAWELQDFTGQSDRARRAKQLKAEEANRKMQLAKLQRGLGAITPDINPEEHPELPSWAVKRW